MKQPIIHVTIYEEKNPTEDSPLATVRYTEYSNLERSRVVKVNQVNTTIQNIFTVKFYRLLAVDLMFQYAHGLV